MSIENPNSVEHKEKDSGYEANLDSLDAKFLETQKKIQRLTQLDPNEGKEYGSKRRFLKSLISYSLSASMMLAGIAEVQRYVTRYNVHKTGQGVEAVFEHQDSETTFWIDYLSGRKELPQEIRLEIYKSHIKVALERNDIPVPDGFDKLTAPQIQNFIFNNSKSYEKLSAWRLSLKKGQTLIDEIIPRRFPRKDPIYYALWHLEETAGNPKIRADLNDRAHYEAFSNTMFIGGGTQKEIIEQFISESSHGVQVDSAPVTTAFRVLKDTVSQGAAALMHQESMHQVHDESAYDTPGTTEYEAHKIIQPQLEDQYKKDTKSYQIVAKNLNKNHGQPNQSAKAKTNSHRS